MKLLTKLAVVAVCAIFCLAPAPAQAEHPGVLTIDWGEHLDGAEPTVTVRVSPTLMRFLATMASGAAAEAAQIQGLNEVIDQFREVRVEVYEGVASASEITAAAESETAKLTNAGWETVVRAWEDDELANVLMLPRDGTIVGVAVVAVDGDELAFINVAGDFDPQTLGKHLGTIVREVAKGKGKLGDLVEDLEREIESVVEEVDEHIEIEIQIDDDDD